MADVTLEPIDVEMKVDPISEFVANLPVEALEAGEAVLRETVYGQDVIWSKRCVSTLLLKVLEASHINSQKLSQLL